MIHKNSNTPTIIVIIGITGDLARRKIIPALIEIARSDIVPKDFHIVGVTRQRTIDIKHHFKDIKNFEYIEKQLTLFSMDMDKGVEYERLIQKIDEIQKRFGVQAQRLFYIATPPQASGAIIKSLGLAGIAKIPRTKLLLEKPFGTDLESAKELLLHINTYFPEQEMVYCIDHYLAKEMVQNVIIFREHNPLFKNTWNNNFIDRIEISATETIGIEGRANFYEQTGALRDIVQSHLLQLAAITLLDSTESMTHTISQRRYKALSMLRIASDSDGTLLVQRAQYKGYKEEVNNPLSNIETYVSLTLESMDPRWLGVPIILMTGKRLNKKNTEIRIYYKKESNIEPNELIMHVQPNEGIQLVMWSKCPGYEKKIEKNILDFKYVHNIGVLREAYEQVLIDAIYSDRDLFISNKEVLESWRIIAPVQKIWQISNEILPIYHEDGVWDCGIIEHTAI